MAQDTLLGFPAHTLPYRRGAFTTLSTVSRGTVSKRSLFYTSSDRIFGDSMKFMVSIQEDQQRYMPQNML